MNYSNITDAVCQIAYDAASYIKAEARQLSEICVETKSLNNFVTRVDRNAEQLLVERLSKLIPEAGFIVEEETIAKHSPDLNWIIDPLDGTTNFIHGIPCFSVSIALQQGDETVVGVVYEVNKDECFSAYKDGTAMLNGSTIRVSEKNSLAASLLATGFPYHDYNLLEEYLKLLGHLVKTTHGIRRLGSAAVDLAYVACGRFEGFYEYGLNSWDVAAGSLIVKQAGGHVSDFSGENNYIFGRELIATNSHIHQELLQIIRKYFHK